MPRKEKNTVSDITPVNHEHNNSNDTYVNTEHVLDQSVVSSETSDINVHDTESVTNKSYFGVIDNKKGIKLASLNVRSLLDKLDQLRIILASRPLDILAINETFLDSNILTSQLNIDGYIFERYDRGSRHGGGVGFYIRDNLQYALYKQDVISQHNIEALFIKLKRPHRDAVLVGTIYRPPSAKTEYYDNIVNVLDHIIDEHDCIVMGDLNYNYVLDESLSTNPIHYLSQLYGLTQLVSEPTRITTSSSTLIDVILTTIPESHVCTGVIKLTLSDHYLPYTILTCQAPKVPPKCITVRDFKNFNNDSFLSDLTREFTDVFNVFNDSCIVENPNIHMLWLKWKSTFEKVCSHHAPLKTIKVRDRINPWLTRDIVSAMHERDYIHNKAVKFKDNELMMLYKRKRNSVVRMINNAQKLYYEQCVNTSNNKNRDMWKSLRHILNTNNKSIVNTQNVTADNFNSFFANIGKDLADKIPKCTYNWHLPQSIYDFIAQPITNEFVTSQLRLLSDKSNLDVLNIDSKLLRVAAPVLCPSLAYLINKSITSGEIPDDWKLAKITPIFKNKGSKDDCGNYRPISVICHVAKVMEKAVQVQLKDYLLEHNFITHVQSAYLKNHSTQSSLHNIVSDLLDGINENCINGLCFLDLQKCFDTIDHAILLTKMEKYGIRGISLKWFSNYLSCRKQRVKLNDDVSSLMEILFGVPQGSILGPILFLLFINDLPTCLTKCQCNLFADDTVLYTTNNKEKDVLTDLQTDMNNVFEWFKLNRLSVNVSKSCTMFVTNRNIQDQAPLTINDQPMLSVKETTYLGVTLNNDLTWNRQISNMLYVPKPRIDKFKQSFQYIGPSLYNTFPQDVKESSSLSVFKKRSKEHILA